MSWKQTSSAWPNDLADSNTPVNKLITQISDSLLQQIRDYLDAEADLIAVGSDPAQADQAQPAFSVAA